jgi:hypothetical protein
MSGLPLPTSTLQSLKFFEVKISQNLPNVAHDKYVKLVNSVIAMNRSEFVSLASTELTQDSSGEDGLSIDSTKAITKTLVNITGIKHTRHHCCVNSCIAYTEPYHLETQCPFIKCKEPRYDARDLPRQTYDLIPITHRLRLQYANSKRAEILKGYRKGLAEDPWPDGLRDYWDGELHKKHKADGFFEDDHDIALAFSTDGLQLFPKGQYGVWPLLLINLNLPPEIRVKKDNLILCGVIPGPNSPKDIHSFLKPVVDELKQLETGIPNVYDASTGEMFTLRAHVVFVSGDLPAISKLMGISGHNSYDHCRFCELRGIHHKHIYCPLRSPRRWRETFRHDPAHLPLRNNTRYREVASTLRLQYDPVTDPKNAVYGVLHISSLYDLQTIDFPRSFPTDVMHLVFANVVPSLFEWWTGRFLNDDVVVDNIRLHTDVWKDIGGDMDRSRKTIPTSFGRALRNIEKYWRSFKAEEWSAFLISYSPILLRNRLPAELYAHYLKLVTAVTMAVDYEITFDDCQTIKTLLEEFVSDYERLYYRYQLDRLRACLPTIHLLLHLADSILDCGPAWNFWQFPCERLCGMLKPMVHSRVSASRNLSLGILYLEQYKYLPFATGYVKSIKQHGGPTPYTATINERQYSFLYPRAPTCLSTTAIKDSLVNFYAVLLQRTQQDVTDDPGFSNDIIQWGRCRLAGDKDVVSSSWNENRRDMVSHSRQSSAIQYSEDSYGRVINFFCHTFGESTRMLAYVQSYIVTDHSRRMQNIRHGALVELNTEGRKEVICVSTIKGGIGVMNASNKRYLVTRGILSMNEDSEDETV